jgi:hypothetical protein
MLTSYYQFTNENFFNRKTLYDKINDKILKYDKSSLRGKYELLKMDIHKLTNKYQNYVSVINSYLKKNNNKKKYEKQLLKIFKLISIKLFESYIILTLINNSKKVEDKWLLDQMKSIESIINNLNGYYFPNDNIFDIISLLNVIFYRIDDNKIIIEKKFEPHYYSTFNNRYIFFMKKNKNKNKDIENLDPFDEDIWD